MERLGKIKDKEKKIGLRGHLPAMLAA